MRSRWLSGNKVRLLENGEDYYPAVFAAIRAAQTEVLIETFIIFEDKVGMELHGVLVDAARRGVRVDLLVDGFGTADLSQAYLDTLRDAGVAVRAFDPMVRVLKTRWNWLRRMHRKIVVVDGHTAFVGGINFCADHLKDFGPQAKQDYAVELKGPIVDEIRIFAKSQIRGRTLRQRWQNRRSIRRERAQTAPQVVQGSADAMFVTRDNTEHRNDIERHYRVAIRAARKRVVIANAYFFPGYRLLRELKRAARRGVDVQLILQGEPDVPFARTCAQLLYEYLQRGGVRVYEYCERPIHAKVAVVDDEWATVGSSNLDPLSLSLNLEANVMLRDRDFNAELHARLQHLIANACEEIVEPPRHRWAWLHAARGFLVFHFLRSFQGWASWLPRHAPKLAAPLSMPHPVVQPGAKPLDESMLLQPKACDAR